MALSFRSTAKALLLSFLIPLCLAAVPANITILSTRIPSCTSPYSVTVQPSTNHSSINILYDTSKSTNSTPDTLAWTDSESANVTQCVVCADIKWTGNLYGSVVSVDYEYDHRVDPGLLELVNTWVFKEGDVEDNYEWFDSSYIYGGEDTQNITSHVSTHVANSTMPMVLDFEKERETVCVKTDFSVFNRVGFTGVGEISKRSLFEQRVNVEWSERL